MSAEKFAADRRRVYFVRHGAVQYFDSEGRPYDPRGVPLSPEGGRQVETLAAALADAPIDRAVCSGMPRTRQTGEIVLRGRDVVLEADERFKEIRAGRFREIAPEHLERAIARAYAGSDAPGGAFVGGELFGDFQARVLSAFDALLADRGWRHLLIASHDGVNRVLLGWASGRGLAAWPAFEQDTACLNIVDFDGSGDDPDRRWIRLMNFTPYDPAKRHLYLNSMERIYLAYRPDAH